MKVLLFLAKGFETIVASVFIDVFGWASTFNNYDVEVVAFGVHETAVSAFGVPVKVGLLLKDVNTDDYNAQHKMIASVCVGALALANAGKLTGKRATTYHLNGRHRQKQLAAYGVEFINEPVVKPENIITSYCPQTAPEVAFVHLGELIGEDKMLVVKPAMGF